MGQQGKVKAKESLANKIPGEEWVEADLRAQKPRRSPCNQHQEKSMKVLTWIWEAVSVKKT